MEGSGGGVLDPWISQMGKQDIRLKLKIGEDLLTWIEDESNSLHGEDVGALIDGLINWLGSSNSKIQQNGLEVLSRVVVRLREDFRPYISPVLTACTDRMGDAKEIIRDTNADLLNKMMEVTSPQYILDRLTGAYTHKNFRVREEILLLMQDTVMRYTASCLTLSKFIPSICKLMDDPNAQVRDTAMTTLVVIYRYVGDRLRHDLQRKYAIQPSKLQVLMERFDKAVDNGDMLVAFQQDAPADEPDRAAPKTKPPMSVKKPALAAKPSASSAASSGAGGTLGRSAGARTGAATSAAASAGAVDDESFIEAFLDVPRISVFSARELEHQLANIRTTISNTDVEWDKRLNALKLIRSLVVAGAKDYDEFLPALKTLELPVQACVKDLRSQIVREACITISYLCVQLNTKMDRFCELLLPSLILLMGATVKVMSTSGVVCIRFILKHVPSQRLVPVVIQNLSSKNRDLRRHCFEFLHEMLVLWPTFTLERHIAILQQAIKAGLSDADQEARVHARKCFWAFAEHFKAQADSLLFSLDSNKQKMLHGEHGGVGGMSNSSSSSSLTALGRGVRSAYGNSMESLRHGSAATGVGSASSAASRAHLASTSRLPQAIGSTAQQRRANSAIDMSAAKSSRLKALSKPSPSSAYGAGYSSPYANPGAGLSLPRSATAKTPRAESVSSAVTSPERTPQQSRGRQVSQSQPNSRSASPSSRWSYATYGAGMCGDGQQRRTTSRSRIPMATSRDPSPSRSIGSHSSSSVLSDSQRRRRSSLSRYGGGRGDAITIVPSTTTAAEKLLRNSREAEERMAEALGSTAVRSPISAYSRQSFGLLHREDSDASSIASDRSFRHEDVPEILANLASVHWSDRKDGLTGLLCLLRNQSHALGDPDLQKVTQTLTKMFMDPHTKVFSLFLDTLNELITVHSGDLHRIGFLSVLLTKLFIKSGQDLLGSVVAKIGRTMDLIRASFPRHDQFTVITRFLNDPAHSSSSVKVKLSVLNYLEALTSLMDSTELPAHDPNLRDTLLKVTAWAGDTRHPELQQRSRQVIVSLYRVKTPYFSTVITQMAPEFQRTALDVIQNQLKMASQHGGSGVGGGALNNNNNNGCNNNNNGTNHQHHPTSPKPFACMDFSGGGSVPLSPLSGPRSRLGSAHQSPSPQRSFEDENTENFRANPTTQLKLMQALYREQQQQQQQGLHCGGGSGSIGSKSIDDDADSYKTRASQGSSSSPKVATPQQSFEFESASVASGISSSGSVTATAVAAAAAAAAAAKSSATERLAHCVQLLSSPMNSAEQKRSALAELHILIKDSSLWESDVQFRAVWRALIANLTDEGGREGVRAPALRGLAELIRRRPQHAQSTQMAQAALEAVIRVYNDKDKDVVRLADAAVTALVTSVDSTVMAQACARCVAMCLTGPAAADAADGAMLPSEPWAICAAIRTVTRLAEVMDTSSAKPQLAALGPELIRAYNHPESSVRKAAVFALVGLHQRVGADAMHPYVSHLPGCKLRLLNLYIDRAAQQSNGQPRGESSPSPSSCSNASNM